LLALQLSNSCCFDARIMPRKGSKRRKTRTHALPPPEGAPDTEDGDTTPRSFVVKSGKVGKHVAELVEEMRGVMEPNTARNLRERSKNSLKDYVAVAAPLGVTHLLVFGQTEKSLVYRIARAPEGPTLMFKVLLKR
jgi:ribosome biogenesis protein SSF1/2